MSSVYKMSRYNLLYRGGKNPLIYNTYSTGILELDDPRFAALIQEAMNDTGCLTAFSLEQLQVLRDNGFIVEQDIDELDMIRFRFRKGAYDTYSFALQLLPTTGCNFVCPYCFEKSKIPEYMSEDDCKQIEQFIENFIGENKTQEMQLGWYGGEPLLCPDIIKRITTFVHATCQKRGVQKEGMTYLVTNGYLLDDNIASELSGCGVESVQITIDGGRKEHDAQRYLPDGRGTYDKVLGSVYIASRYFKEVIVRFNLNRKNYKSVITLVDTEKVFREGNVAIFPGYLKSYLSGGSTREEDLYLFTGEEFRKVQGDLLKRNKSEHREDMLFFPAKLNNCTADAYHGFNIGPGGKVYKCLERIEPGEVVGLIENGRFQANAKYWPWLMDEPYDDPHCAQCIYLPTCMGGCPSLRRLIGVPNHETCDFWKEYIDDKLSVISTSGIS